MAYKRYKMLQKYINGEAIEEFKQGALISDTTFPTIEECNEGNQRPDQDIEGDLYEWRRSSETMCNGVNKYYIDKEYVSYDDGQTWSETGRTRQGDLVEADSSDCQHTVYRWIVVSGAYICNGVDKYEREKEQQSNDNGVSWFDTGATRLGDLIQRDSMDCKSYESKYLTFESLEDNNEIYLSTRQTGSKQVFISTDDGLTWTEKTARNLVVLATLNRGERMMIKANNETYSKRGGNYSDYSHFQVRKPYNLSGNIMSLVYGDDFVGQTELTSTYTFHKLFSGLMQYEGITGTLVSAENLILPATSDYCYYELFEAERRLTTPPKLPSTTLATSCYSAMFSECTSLLTTPQLPATTLATRCYSGMFQGCTSLTTPTALPATTMATSCYSSMYEGCTSLTTAPELPATTLADGCYYCMFYGCTSLTTAPELPATTLVNNCYTSLFYGCTSLNYIKALFTTEPNTSYTASWVGNVAANGTFVKNSAAEWIAWIERGQNTIPDNWSIINA